MKTKNKIFERSMTTSEWKKNNARASSFAEDEEELQWFDLCGCDNHAGHMCEESRQRYGRV